ncbi:hypothetical protein [Streptomyces sp. T028]|uniref:hypothetical protein n=1 Tax=Streptomyces sp. T028 TaxID=3394379 RepID=UPI003A863EAF
MSGSDDAALPDDIDTLVSWADAAQEEYAGTGDPEAAERAVLLWRRITAEAAHPDTDFLTELGHALLDRFEALGDPEDLTEARAAYEAAHRAEQPEQPFTLNNLANCMRVQYELSGAVDLLDDAGATLLRALELTDPDDTDPDDTNLRCTLRDNLGLVLAERYDRDGDAQDLARAVEAHREAVVTSRPDDPNRLLYLTNLGSALQTHYDLAGDRSAMDEAVSVYQEAIDSTDQDSPDLPLRLANLSGVLLARHRRGGKASDLDTAVALAQSALAAGPPSSADRQRQTHTLAEALRTRYEDRGDIDDLTLAITLYRAVYITDRPALRASCAVGLAGALLALYERNGDAAALAEAEAVCRHARSTSPSFGREPAAPALLGRAVLEAYRRTGDGPALDEAVRFLDRAWTMTPLRAPARSGRAGDLAVALLDRWDGRGAPEDLVRATGLLSEESPGSPSGDDVPQPLVGGLNAAAAGLRFAAPGPRLDELVARLRALLERTAPAAPVVTRLLDHLAVALRLRHSGSGDAEDLEAAVALHRQALARTERGGPQMPGLLRELANDLLDRFTVRGHVVDLEESLACLNEAVALTPPTAPARHGLLNDLGNALRTHYEHFTEPDTLARALAAFREAADSALPAAPDQPVYLDNLASALVDHYLRTSDAAALDEALQAYDRALALLPADSPEVPRTAANRAGCLWHLWREREDARLLEAAVDALTDVLGRLPGTAVSRPLYLNNLACFLRDRHRLSGDPGDADEATALFRDACRSGAATEVLWSVQAALNWAGWAQSRGEHREAAEACTRGLAVLRQVFRRQATRAHKESWLRSAEVLSAGAARAHAALGDARAAVVALETGRAMLLSEALERNHSVLNRLERVGLGGQAERYRAAVGRLTAAVADAASPDPVGRPSAVGLRAPEDTAR